MIKYKDIDFVDGVNDINKPMMDSLWWKVYYPLGNFIEYSVEDFVENSVYVSVYVSICNSIYDSIYDSIFRLIWELNYE